MERTKIAIYGAGQGGHVLREAAEGCGFEVLYFIDDFKEGCVKPQNHDKSIPVACEIYDRKRRLEIRDMGFKMQTIIHGSKQLWFFRFI